MKIRFIAIFTGVLLMPAITFAGLPTLDVLNTGGNTMELIQTGFSKFENSQQVLTLQQTMSKIGSAKSTISDFINNTKEKVLNNDLVKKAKEYKTKIEEYKTKYEAVKAEAEKYISMGKDVADKAKEIKEQGVGNFLKETAGGLAGDAAGKLGIDSGVVDGIMSGDLKGAASGLVGDAAGKLGIDSGVVDGVMSGDLKGAASGLVGDAAGKLGIDAAKAEDLTNKTLEGGKKEKVDAGVVQKAETNKLVDAPVVETTRKAGGFAAQKVASGGLAASTAVSAAPLAAAPAAVSAAPLSAAKTAAPAAMMQAAPMAVAPAAMSVAPLADVKALDKGALAKDAAKLDAKALDKGALAKDAAKLDVKALDKGALAKDAAKLDVKALDKGTLAKDAAKLDVKALDKGALAEDAAKLDVKALDKGALAKDATKLDVKAKVSATKAITDVKSKAVDMDKTKRQKFKSSFGYGKFQNTQQLSFAFLGGLGDGDKTGETAEGVLIVPESASLSCDMLNYEDATKDKKMDACLKKINTIANSMVTEKITKKQIDDATRDINNSYVELLTATYFEALEIYNETLTFKNNKLSPVLTTSTSDIDGSWRIAKEMHIVLGDRINLLHKLWSRVLAMKMFSKYATERFANKEE